ncbi:DNA-binding protein [Paraburkholderia caribensis]|uniref:Helix-turn-helix domain-containing protein n=2 Tax=Paraburkholderia TaxID=1822464 RepID=B2JXM2_PARP8|nr:MULTISPECIES: hypothetical protein [Paraburkholderia]ACC76380.1 hypothetical protein Bphy_7415 [Paraburkholderia phymatum STM815]MCO4882882.1 DNA-binding protein [Paraburkholderia caribensis]PTB24606.1 DNA-binding protein [Paraburkholderia caribensis]
MTSGRFYTLEEIARELHIAPATARNRLTLGLPMQPSLLVGRRRLFPVDEYEKWIASQLTRTDARDADDFAAPDQRGPSHHKT